MLLSPETACTLSIEPYRRRAADHRWFAVDQRTLLLDPGFYRMSHDPELLKEDGACTATVMETAFDGSCVVRFTDAAGRFAPRHGGTVVVVAGAAPLEIAAIKVLRRGQLRDVGTRAGGPARANVRAEEVRRAWTECAAAAGTLARQVQRLHALVTSDFYGPAHQHRAVSERLLQNVKLAVPVTFLLEMVAARGMAVGPAAPATPSPTRVDERALGQSVAAKAAALQQQCESLDRDTG
jgi:hypothetical protein